MLACHDHGKLLGHQMRFALAPDSSRVDEAKALAIPLDHLVDGIACRAGDRGDDGSIRFGEAVQERRLADVGMADDCNSHFRRPASGVRRQLFCLARLSLVAGGWLFCCALCSACLGKMCDYRIEQLVDAASVLGGNREHSLDTEAVEITHEG